MMPRTNLELFRQIEYLQSAYIATATDDGGETESYPAVRSNLLELAPVSDLLPEFVHRYRTLAQFWPFIKRKFSTYADRREFIWNSFQPVLEYTGR